MKLAPQPRHEVVAVETARRASAGENMKTEVPRTVYTMPRIRGQEALDTSELDFSVSRHRRRKIGALGSAWRYPTAPRPGNQ